MPTSYTGSAGSHAVTDAVTISDPNDGELASAASNDSAPKTLADFIKFILDTAGFLAVARTWTAIQTFSAINEFNVAQHFNGTNEFNSAQNFNRPANFFGDGDANAMFQALVNPAGTWKLITALGGTAGRHVRLYYGLGTFCVTVNAYWDQANTRWQQDSSGTGNGSYRFLLNRAGASPFALNSVPAFPLNSPPGAFAEGSWDTAELASNIAKEALHYVGSGGGAPAFNSTWNNKSVWPKTSFWKDASGVIHLEGSASGANTTTDLDLVTVYTLPTGYRPAGPIQVPAVINFTASAPKIGTVQISASGDIVVARNSPSSDPTVAVHFFGISFRTDVTIAP